MKSVLIMNSLSTFIFARQLAFLLRYSWRMIVFGVSLSFLAAVFGGFVFLIIFLIRKK